MMTIEAQRARRRLTFACILSIAVLLALALGGPLAWQLTDKLTAESSQACINIETRDHIRELMIEGLDQAFRAHVGSLFDVWMRDGGPEPVRAQRGLKNGVSAYTRSRASAIRWQPPCTL